MWCEALKEMALNLMARSLKKSTVERDHLSPLFLFVRVELPVWMPHSLARGSVFFIWVEEFG